MGLPYPHNNRWHKPAAAASTLMTISRVYCFSGYCTSSAFWFLGDCLDVVQREILLALRRLDARNGVILCKPGASAVLMSFILPMRLLALSL